MKKQNWMIWRMASCALIIAVLMSVVLTPSVALAAPDSAVNQSREQVHVVRSGETLSQIAVKYGVSVHALMKANMISDPNKIYAGQRLMIPGGDMGGWMEPDMGQSMCRTYHTVGKWETGSDIAREYEVSTYSLAQANGLDDVNNVYPGQKLCIPNSKEPVNPPVHPKPEMPKPKPEHKPQDNGCTIHVVKRGDTLSKIATWYGVNMMQIMKLNGIMDPNRIEVGERLKIDCGMDMGWMPEQRPMPDPMPMPMPEQRPMPDPMPKPMPKPEQRPMPDPMPMPKPMPEQRPMPDPMPQHKPMKPMMEVEQGPWRGYYYCDKYFGGEPVIVREDYDIRFNWYGGSPGEMVPNDNFSVKWERTAKLAGGWYRWVAVADDGVRIYVNDKLVLDGWREQPATEYTAEFYVEPGHHKFRVEYYEEGNEASINVRLEAVWK